MYEPLSTCKTFHKLYQNNINNLIHFSSLLLKITRGKNRVSLDSSLSSTVDTFARINDTCLNVYTLATC